MKSAEPVTRYQVGIVKIDHAIIQNHDKYQPGQQCMSGIGRHLHVVDTNLNVVCAKAQIDQSQLSFFSF